MWSYLQKVCSLTKCLGYQLVLQMGENRTASAHVINAAPQHIIQCTHVCTYVRTYVCTIYIRTYICTYVVCSFNSKHWKLLSLVYLYITILHCDYIEWVQLYIRTTYVCTCPHGTHKHVTLHICTVHTHTYIRTYICMSSLTCS